jgi:hypothetical protein
MEQCNLCFSCDHNLVARVVCAFNYCGLNTLLFVTDLTGYALYCNSFIFYTAVAYSVCAL